MATVVALNSNSETVVMRETCEAKTAVSAARLLTVYRTFSRIQNLKLLETRTAS